MRFHRRQSGKLRINALLWLVALLFIACACMKLKPKPAPPPSLLDRRITELHLDPMPLDQALERLGKAAGVKIVLDRAAFRGPMPLTGSEPVHLFDVRLETAIQICADSFHVASESDGQVVRVTFASSLPLVARVYDVRDIIDRVPPSRFAPIEPGRSHRDEMMQNLTHCLRNAIRFDDSGMLVDESEIWIVGESVVLTAPARTHAAFATHLRRIRESDRLHPWTPAR